MSTCVDNFNYWQKTTLKVLLFCVVVFLVVIKPVAAMQLATVDGVDTNSKKSFQMVAPGDSVPIRLQLQNFGEGKKVDVTVSYRIYNNDNVLVYNQNETVAVFTTASFVRDIFIPIGLPSGLYSIQSIIFYNGQKYPATSQYQFKVAKKIGGLFITQWIIYIIYTLVTVFVTLGMIRIIRLYQRRYRYGLHKYRHVNKGQREFYEMVGDIIMQMHYHVGEKAFDVANNVDGLEIDMENGRIKSMTKNPAEIAALLLLYYQKEFGRSLEYDKKQGKKVSRIKLSEIDKYIEIIRKYF